jgi:hypothetical protein
MKILLLNQFFWPDSSATSQLLTDLSRSLSEAGHEVTVVCSEKGGYASAAQHNAPPVHVLRVKGLRFTRGTLGRISSYLTFYLGAAFRSLTLPKQQIVLTLTTPPLLPLLGTVVKLVRGSRHFIWEMDLYPDIAVDLGYFKANGILDRVVGACADYSRRKANGILALGECMANRLEMRSTRFNESWSPKVWVAHNWADGADIVPVVSRENTDKLTLLYSGNVGLAHDFATVLGSIETLGEDPRFRFYFQGSGARLSEISDFIDRSKLTTISLGAFVSRSTLANSLATCDVGLVTQREVVCGSVVPSKIYGLLAAGKPILFIGPSESTAARIVTQFSCGWVITPGDTTGLTTLLKHLAVHRHEVAVAGQLARQALVTHFDLPQGVARILSVLEGRASSNTDLHTSPSRSPSTQSSEADSSMAHASLI